MIKTDEHAVRVLRDHQAKGKAGYPRKVRRYLQRVSGSRAEYHQRYLQLNLLQVYGEPMAPSEFYPWLNKVGGANRLVGKRKELAAGYGGWKGHHGDFIEVDEVVMLPGCVRDLNVEFSFEDDEQND